MVEGAVHSGARSLARRSASTVRGGRYFCIAAGQYPRKLRSGLAEGRIRRAARPWFRTGAVTGIWWNMEPAAFLSRLWPRRRVLAVRDALRPGTPEPGGQGAGGHGTASGFLHLEELFCGHPSATLSVETLSGLWVRTTAKGERVRAGREFCISWPGLEHGLDGADFRRMLVQARHPARADELIRRVWPSDRSAEGAGFAPLCALKNDLPECGARPRASHPYCRMRRRKAG